MSSHLTTAADCEDIRLHVSASRKQHLMFILKAQIGLVTKHI